MEDLRSLRLLTVDEVAALGYWSRASLYRMIAAGTFPCVRRGRSIRIRVVDMEHWVENGGSIENVIPIQRKARGKAA